MILRQINYLLLTLFMSGICFGQHLVCIKFKDLEETIQLICKVDRLQHHIIFINPVGKENGRCESPIWKYKTVRCEVKYRISQDLEQNTTVLVVNKTDVNAYGNWTCHHGTNIGSDTTDTKILRRLPDKMETSEEMSLLKENSSNEQNENKCKSCTLLSVCAICSECRKAFCEICCNTHTLTEKTHNVYQIEHVVTSNIEAKCKRCGQRADDACMKCIKELCRNCSNIHSRKGHNVKRLIHKRGILDNRNRNEISQNNCNVEYQYRILSLPLNDCNSPPPRICGVCFIADGRIIIAESNYRELMVYNKSTLMFKNSLNEEPKGMTKLTENNVAITFPYEREIRIYNINMDSVIFIRKINVSIGKPFSIAYNQNHFAVEIGEGDGGVIGIINENGELIQKIKNEHSFAYFTSNSIRLSLDVDKRKFFVAALSKKAVSCVDYEGNILWTKPIPSPRGIVFVPEVQSDNNIMIASKKWNRIYRMNSDTGTYSLIKFREYLQGPRFIDYNQREKLLCVQENDGEIAVFAYDITSE